MLNITSTLFVKYSNHKCLNKTKPFMKIIAKSRNMECTVRTKNGKKKKQKWVDVVTALKIHSRTRLWLLPLPPAPDGLRSFSSPPALLLPEADSSPLST